MSVLAVAAVLLTAEPDGLEQPTTPPYLPRYAVVQTFINNGAVVPAARLAWDVELIAQPRNVLSFVGELGVAFAAATPAEVGFFWEHVALLGLGYRMTRPSGLHWGFTFGFGGVLYGNRGPNDNHEQKVSTYIEGKLHLGLKLKGMTFSLCGGYGDAPTYDERSKSQPYVGGWFVGILVGWK